MSILKRGVVATPVLILTISVQFSPNKSSTHSEQLHSLFLYSDPLLLWTLKPSIPTSATPYTLICLPSIILKTLNLTHDGNLTTMVYSGVITVSTYQMLMTFASKSYSISTITYCQDTTVRTRHYVKSKKDMSGPNSNLLSSTFVTLVSNASIEKLLITSLTGYSDLFWFQNILGIPYPWILSNNSLLQMVLLPFLLL